MDLSRSILVGQALILTTTDLQVGRFAILAASRKFLTD
jgi:hypothetical protein